MVLRRIFIALVLVTQLASAQEETVARELLELPADVAAQFQERIASIRLQERAIEQLEKKFERARGLRADVYDGRIHSIWASMFNDTVQLARDIAEQQDHGFEVSDIAEQVASRLRVFPEEAIASIARLRGNMIYSSEDMAPGDLAITDQYLWNATQKFDYVLQSMINYMTIADRLGIEDSALADTLVAGLENSAANRAAFLQLALEDVVVFTRAAAALPTDTDIAARLAAHEARIKTATDSLHSAVNMMGELGLDTSHYRQLLVTTTGELTSDVLDVGLISGLIRQWSSSVADLAKSKGPQLLLQMLIIVVILFVFLQLSRLLRKLAARAMKSSRVRASKLLTEMVVAAVANVILFLGLLFALSQVGISLAPLLAGLGIVGFIIGFALQDALSNFGAGMLILFYRPFDVGDFVTAGGVTGKVSHMSLVNTTLKSVDNQVLVVPNTLIWSTVITNLTAQRIRRVDLTFRVAYNDDVEKVERILAEVVAEHELVLDEPKPVIRLDELADSSVKFVCRPWVKTDDYRDVCWDLLRAVKLRFDAEGITIPFPQRTVRTATS